MRLRYHISDAKNDADNSRCCVACGSIYVVMNGKNSCVVCRALPSGEAAGSSVSLIIVAAAAVLSGDPECRLAAAAAWVGRLGVGAVTVQQRL